MHPHGPIRRALQAGEIDRNGLDTPRSSSLDRAFRRILADIREGLRFGYFELHIDCEVITGGRRRVTIRFGKSYQFVIPEDDCVRTASDVDSRDGSDPPDHDEDAGHRRHGEPATGSVPPARGARAAVDA
jgi:hypothetical protein